jgi:hypothetical protein
MSIRSVLRPITDHLVRKLTPHHPPPNITTLPLVPRSPHVSHSATRTQGKDVVDKLSARVARSLETCKNRNLFANDGLWRRRTCACIKTTPHHLSLVCCANAKFSWFGDIGSFKKMRELSTDQLFVMRWTCLSLAANRRYLDDNMLQYWPFNPHVTHL